MKQIFLAVTLVSVLIPNMTFAVWWNPKSWFKASNENAKTQILEKRIQELEGKLNSAPTAEVTTTFYVKQDNSRLRSCASTVGCDPVGYFKRNTEITLKGDRKYKLSDLPEWIENVTQDGVRGYLHKSILSDTFVPTQTNSSSTQDGFLTDDEKKIIDGWIVYIDKELQVNTGFINQIKLRGLRGSDTDVLDLVEIRNSNLKIMRSQLLSAVSANKRDDVISIITRLQEQDKKFVDNLRVVVNSSLQNDRAIEHARAQAVNDAYRQVIAEQQVINQQRIDAANAYVEKYNEIRKAGAANGATEAIVNNQLEAAGLIKQTHCSFSSVGGMTPGSGSVTCY